MPEEARIRSAELADTGEGWTAPFLRVGRAVASGLRLIRFSHTLFALPWGLAGLFLGANGWPSPRILILVVVAMAGARTAAMAFNRLVDRRFDATNPRTAMRPSVTGVVSPRAMTAMVVAGSLTFIGAAVALNPLCGALAIPALAVLLGYSLTKRWSALCHVALGVALGIAPLGGYLAARGTFDAGAGAAALLGLAVVFWTAGFDTIYAVQDVDHDRRESLRSLPARFGVAGALGAARLFHAAVPPVLWIAGREAGLGAWYGAGVIAAAALLVVEHAVIANGRRDRIDLAFFPLNVAVAMVVMAAVLADLLVAGPAR